MKTKHKLITFFSLIIITIDNSAQINSFTSNIDTIFLASTKTRGIGLFDISYRTYLFMDTSSWKKMKGFQYYPDYKIRYPENIQNIKFRFLIKMYDTLEYYDFKTGQVFHQKNFNLSDREIPMITCQIDNKEVLIIDQNDNKDLTDDSLQKLEAWNDDSKEQLISCKYFIDKENGGDYDSSWVKLGKKDNQIIGLTSQYLISDFSIDGVNYKVGIVDENSTSFCFRRPLMCKLSENDTDYDSILKSNIIELGEFIKLGKYYYKFDYLYNGNGAIVLVREENPENIRIAQKGFTLSGFICSTINKDTVTSENLCKDKPLLIANISGCFPDAYKLLKEIDSRCSNSLNILWLEYEVFDDWVGNIVDTSIEFNNDVYLKYRNAYSSYTCYLIDTNQKIIDEFHLFDWKINLLKYIHK